MTNKNMWKSLRAALKPKPISGETAEVCDGLVIFKDGKGNYTGAMSIEMARALQSNILELDRAGQVDLGKLQKLKEEI